MDALVAMQSGSAADAVLTVLLAFAVVAWMAIAYRVRGGLRPWGADMPRWMDLLAVSAPIAAASAIGIESGLQSAVSFAVVLAATMGTVALGHGEQMDLARTPEHEEGRNWVDRIVGRKGWAREALGLALGGALATAPAGAAVMGTGRLGAGFAFALWGAGKTVMYEAAHRSGLRIRLLEIAPDDRGRNPPAGELLYGAWLGIGVVWLVLSR